MASIFFSYSHADEALRDRLEVGLAMLKRQGVIDTWHDRRIPVGDELDDSISKELNQADIVLILVSPDFLASRYCYDVEMMRALERHRAGEARLIPVILRPSDWQASHFSGLLATPKDGKPITRWTNIDEAFQDVVASIRAALPSTKRQQAIRREPVAAPSSQISKLAPRSSNLRIAKEFSDAAKDRFLSDAFEYMSNFFEGSLDELAVRNEGIETAFRQIDRNRFTAIVYRNGSAVARCKIMLRGARDRGITYADDDDAPDGTMSDILQVKADDREMYLSPLMTGYGSDEDIKYSFETASEHYWARLIERLQRR